MKKVAFLMIAVGMLLSSCEKEYPEPDLPTEVEIGKSVVFLNGEIASGYLPDFRIDTINGGLMNFGFVEKFDNVINVVGFAWLPKETGEFILHTDRIPFIGAKTNFAQTVSEDLTGYKYKLVEADEGFFNIEYLDTINMEVRGRFKAKFCRTSKNGLKGGDLPKTLNFESVFNEKYRFQ